MLEPKNNRCKKCRKYGKILIMHVGKGFDDTYWLCDKHYYDSKGFSLFKKIGE